MINAEKYRHYVLILSLLWFHGSILLAQSPSLQHLHFRRLSTKDGLQNNINNVIYQDSKGYIWMGGYGLQRFDGYRFQDYLTAADNCVVTQIIDDEDNNLYLVNEYHQLLKYDNKSGKFDLFQDSILSDGKRLPVAIQQMKKDKYGNIWFSLYGELAILEKGKIKLNIISDKWGLKGKKHNGHFFIDGNEIWMISKENGILRYNITTKVLTSKIDQTNENDILQYTITDEYSLTKDKKGNFWFTDAKVRQLIKFEPNTKKKKYFQFPYQNITDGKKNTYISSLYSAENGELWVVLGEHVGLARFDFTKDTFDILYSDKSKEYGLYDDIVIGSVGGFLTGDRQGNFWFTGDGILMFNPSAQKFRTILTQDVVKKVFKNPQIKLANAQSSPNDFIEMNNGKIYVGYYGLGIIEMDKNFENPKNIDLPPGISELIWKLFTADGDILYFGDQKKQLCSYNTINRQFKIFNQKEFDLAYLSASYTENSQSVWLGFFNDEGLRNFNPDSKLFTGYKNIFSPEADFKTHIYDIEPKDEGQFWLATNQRGLLLFDKKSGKIIKTFHPLGTSELTHLNTVFSIERYNQDTLLLSTSSGLIIFDTKRDTKTTISIKNGMPENQCMSSITELNKRYVWINTATRGICRLDIKNLTVSQIGSDQGNILVLGSNSNFKSKQGDIVFGHSKGFTIILPVKEDAFVRDSVHISDITVNNVSVNPDSTLRLLKEMTVDYKSNHLKIGFSTLNYWTCTATEYYIFISGIHTEWESLGNKSDLELRGLAPGKYELMVKAIDKNNLHESGITKFAIQIEPPFYRTWWFFILMILFFTGILYRILKWRQQELLKVEQLKTAHYKKELEVEQQKREVEKIRQEMTEVQLSALRSQMNPHFIFNSLNSINNYIIKNDIHTASDYLTKFSRLIRLILDNSKNNEITLTKELETLRLYLLIEAARFNNKFNYYIELDDNLDAEHIMIPPTTIQPFVENAIWHGIMHLAKPGELIISIINHGEKKILITIDDNGVGRAKSAELDKKPDAHRSHGVNITKSRIMQLHPDNSIQIDDKYDKEGQPAGTKVSILLNFQNTKDEV
ncbi:MAG: histidine kinase [Saprospiraceae bacterium]|nr:histidine kinase [Saprospiraceae bacterium]